MLRYRVYDVTDLQISRVLHQAGILHVGQQAGLVRYVAGGYVLLTAPALKLPSACAVLSCCTF